MKRSGPNLRIVPNTTDGTERRSWCIYEVRWIKKRRLWDYGKEVTESLSGLTKTLKMRFGGKAFADKHRIEIRNRRRKPDETLQSLHIDIRRLAALAFPSMEHRTREVIACDYFLDALADPEFALKIRERYPEDLDSALRIALQLEVWTKDSTLRGPEK